MKPTEIVIISIAAACFSFQSCKDPDRTEKLDPAVLGICVNQEKVNRIEAMPDIPDSYMMMDWKQKAIDYDSYVFSWNRQERPGPLIWLDDTQRNIKQTTFGLYTTVGDSRQGPSHPSSHEAINTMAAVLGGGLVGIDKTSQDGFNYPKMLQNYFAKDNGWDIMLNGTSGYATDWWYDILPNLLYYGVCDVFPDVSGADEIQKSIADKFSEADGVLGDNYSHSYFNYGNMEAYDTGIPHQEDAAGGQGYLLLCAYNKFGDKGYLEHSKHAIEVLNSQTESRFYEILMPFGAFTAAYLNAVEGTSYNVKQMLDWTFNGCTSSSGRNGWGVILGQWGSYDVYGLQGSVTDGGGYAFLMNSLEMAWPLVPLVKYQPEFALMIGKWMLNNASACRLFFPQYIADGNQYLPQLKNLTGNNVGYEGLRYSDRYGKLSAHPVAEGDGPTWTGSNSDTTMFSLYSTSPVGILGAIVNKTDVEGILRLDCNATDFYSPKPYPVNLFYNPFKSDQSITYLTSGNADLFDIVSNNYVARDVSGQTRITIPAGTAMVITELPAGTELNSKDGHIIADRKWIISY